MPPRRHIEQPAHKQNEHTYSTNMKQAKADMNDTMVNGIHEAK
jgi:hypothetical protein